MLEQVVIETEILARLMGESEKDGWQFSTSVEDVPTGIGSYALYDGLKSRGLGITYNMQEAIKRSCWYGQMKRPIYSWQPDTDGSAALWLDGKMRCRHCEQETILDVFEAEKHFQIEHGLEAE